MTLSLNRRIAVAAGGAAIIGMGFLTAGCSSSQKEAPPSTTPSVTSVPSVSPTEKATAIKPSPSISDRGGMDSHPCPAGQSKYNGVCG